MSVFDKELIINGKVVRSPEQQVYKNMKDIEELQEIIKPEYTTAEGLTSSSVSVAIADTNAPEGTTEGWLITQDGLKFKITGGDDTNLLLEYYANLKGPQGNDGEDGTDGITPNITAAASVDSQVGTPSVVVTKTGTDAAPTFTFAFHNLKGETGTSLIEVEVVASLPASGNTGILYFVPSSDPALQNVYDEYIWINSGWERLGQQNIDLTNYIQKSYTSGLVKNDGTIDTKQYVTLDDIKPVLLWENPNPTNNFGTQTLSIPTLSNYKFILVEWKHWKGDSNTVWCGQVEKLEYVEGGYFNIISTSTHRQCQITSSTTIEIGNANNSNNELIIPVKIYGSNI